MPHKKMVTINFPPIYVGNVDKFGDTTKKFLHKDHIPLLPWIDTFPIQSQYGLLSSIKFLKTL